MTSERTIQRCWWLLGGGVVLLLVLAMMFAVRPDAGKPAAKSARGPVKEKRVREARTFGGPDRQSVQPGRRPRKAGEMVATVESGGKHYELAPNRLGTFQRIHVQPGETVPIAISYPNCQPGDPVLIEAEDSGKLRAQAGCGGGGVGMTGRLNDQRTVEFAFEVSQNRGIHRVLLRA